MSECVEVAETKFDIEIFTEGFRDRRGPNACTSKCCRHGVYLDPAERDRILDHADVIEKYFDDTQTKDRSKWFDNTEDEDSDFPSGKCVSTEVYNGKCTFLDRKGRCVLQVVETEEKMPRFSLKPYYCILFPIVKIDGVFKYDDFCKGESDCCTASDQCAMKMIESCSTELQYALGISKYDEVLNHYRNSVFDSKNQKTAEGVQSGITYAGKDAVNVGK
ncbi:MAG TPA: hypothetical protein VLX91_06255 [Candidatus Acidoferrales bacterium]|nr:hypothetical protein [Candidatus Acidoferrales bacterium]